MMSEGGGEQCNCSRDREAGGIRARRREKACEGKVKGVSGVWTLVLSSDHMPVRGA
jgi:hypothetical protein